MPRKATIIIPQTSDTHRRIANELREAWTREFGGTTAVEGIGTWQDDDGNVVEEENIRIWTVADVTMCPICGGKWPACVAGWVKQQTGEDSVMWMVEDVEAGHA